MDPNEELLGADLMEHRIRHAQIGISRAISALAPIKMDLTDVKGVPPIGINPRHEQMIDELKLVRERARETEHSYRNLKFFFS